MAWLTLGLALVTTPLLLRSVDTLMTEISSLFFITAAIAASIAAVRAPTWRGAGGWGLAAGLLLGLTALTRPGFLYLLPFALLAAAYLCLRRRAWPWGAWSQSGPGSPATPSCSGGRRSLSAMTATRWCNASPLIP
jgi:4-amino-4-deoxy-L-arabinose transferase-like glycosyltransferase